MDVFLSAAEPQLNPSHGSAKLAELRVLLIEDNAADTQLVREMLRDVPELSVSLEAAERLDSGLAMLSAGAADLILLDLSLPESTGYATFAAVQAHGQDVLIVVLSGLEDEDLAVRLVRAGAQDYLLKSDASGPLLARSLRYAVERARADATIRHLYAEAQEAIALRERLMAFAVHDLLNPVTAISLRAQMLTRSAQRLPAELPAQREVSEAADHLLAISLGMAALLADCRDLALPTGAQEPRLNKQLVDLASVVRLATLSCQPANGRPLQLLLPDEPLLVAGDPSRLQRVFQNLLENASKYSPANGTITVEARCEPTAAGATCVAVSVRDQGIGIPEEDLPFIFEPYKRAANAATAAPGSGLGLASARAIVEQHGGSIGLESDPGVGTVVTVWLPAASNPSSSETPPA